MNRFVLCFLAALLCTSISVTASFSSEKDFDKIYDFFQKNALNRKMVLEDEGTMSGGHVAYSFRREAILCNLVRSKNLFSFDQIYIIKQKNWDVQDGKKKYEPRKKDRILVIRYEVGYRRSTDEALGHTQVLTQTMQSWGGTTSLFRMKLDGNRLYIEHWGGLYTDHFAKGGQYYPGTSNSKEVWYVKEGKLIRETRQAVFRVDPKTLNKTFVEKFEDLEEEKGRLPLD